MGAAIQEDNGLGIISIEFLCEDIPKKSLIQCQMSELALWASSKLNRPLLSPCVNEMINLMGFADFAIVLIEKTSPFYDCKKQIIHHHL